MNKVPNVPSNYELMADIIKKAEVDFTDSRNGSGVLLSENRRIPFCDDGSFSPSSDYKGIVNTWARDFIMPGETVVRTEGSFYLVNSYEYVQETDDKIGSDPFYGNIILGKIDPHYPAYRRERECIEMSLTDAYSRLTVVGDISPYNQRTMEDSGWVKIYLFQCINDMIGELKTIDTMGVDEFWYELGVRFNADGSLVDFILTSVLLSAKEYGFNDISSTALGWASCASYGWVNCGYDSLYFPDPIADKALVAMWDISRHDVIIADAIVEKTCSAIDFEREEEFLTEDADLFAIYELKDFELKQSLRRNNFPLQEDNVIGDRDSYRCKYWSKFPIDKEFHSPFANSPDAKVCFGIIAHFKDQPGEPFVAKGDIIALKHTGDSPDGVRYLLVSDDSYSLRDMNGYFATTKARKAFQDSLNESLPQRESHTTKRQKVER